MTGGAAAAGSRRRPAVAAASFGLLAALIAGCDGREAAPPGPAPPPAEAPAAARLEPAGFADLAGWGGDAQAEALAAFRRSCAAILKRPAEAAMNGPAGAAGTAGDWQPACRAAADPAAGAGDAAARAFFAEWFVPHRVVPEGDAGGGLFTGYFEPLLRGAREPGGAFRHPVYRRPADLVAVDLGRFDPTLEGRRVAGRVEGGRLEPYPDRAAIEEGALRGRGLELLWVDDPVALFFLQIQGSGRVRLPDGAEVRVGYADQNGRAYRAIGRDLVEAGELAREAVSMQAIAGWLEAHPDRAAGLMNRNPSYVFFRELGPAEPGAGPPGAMGVALTPGRSIAVDRRHVPLGAPVWVETEAPRPDGPARPFRRLTVAQDTGGAIRGPVRGDVFWGAGELATYAAGHMRAGGRWFLLLPKGLAPAG